MIIFEAELYTMKFHYSILSLCVLENFHNKTSLKTKRLLPLNLNVSSRPLAPRLPGRTLVKQGSPVPMSQEGSRESGEGRKVTDHWVFPSWYLFILQGI